MTPSYSIYDESGELIHELVLCKNPDGRVGWWDTVDGLFRDYTKNGAKIPDVDSGSVQYIDTGVFLDLHLCDGSGVDPAEHAAVCKERDRLQAELQSVIAKQHETESERDGLKVALDGAKLSLKALNEKLVEVTAERDGLVEIVRKCLDACDHCTHNGMEMPCSEMVPPPDCGECILEKGTCCKCDAGSHFEFAGVPEGGGG